MNRLHKTVLMITAGLLIGHTALAQSKQGQVDVTPFIGVLIPTADIVKSGALAAGSPAARHEVDLMLGGKLTYWFRNEWGIGLEVLYAPNNAIESDAFNVPGTVDAKFLTVGGRLVYDFVKDPAKPAWLLTGGLGLFATDYNNPLDMTTGGMGQLGLGLRIPFSKALALRFDLTDYMTFTRWEIPAGGKTDRVFQNDITITGGLTFSLK